MKKFIKATPISLSGVMLGCAALGNLLQSYSENVRYVFGGIAAVLLLWLLLKAVLFPKMIAQDMQNPVNASVAATFPMALMLLSVYAKPFIGVTAMWAWFLAIAMHIALILFFTAKFMLKPQIEKVFASYFIVYVGIAVASITAPAYNMQALGSGIFYFALAALLCLLLFIGNRYIKHPQMPEPTKPLFCIFAAPTSLCLAGYLQSVPNKQLWLVAAMAVLASSLYVMVLIKLPTLLRFKFYPSYAAFTFPFVISAIAIKQTAGYLAKMGQPIAALKYVVAVETILATVLVVYALIRFALAISKSATASSIK